MRFCLPFGLAAVSAFAQMEGSTIIDYGGGMANKQYVNTINLGRVLVSDVQYYWTITAATNGDKTFTFSALSCVNASIANVIGLNIATIALKPICTPLPESAAENLGPIAAAMVEFIHVAPNAPHYWDYQSTVSLKPHLTTAQPLTLPNPSMTFLDGFTYNFTQFDMVTNSVIASFALPPQARAYVFRPTSTGANHEIWAAHAGTANEVSISDLTAGAVLATIPTPSLDPNNSAPTGIVFTKDGNSVLYAAGFYTPDSSGNKGMLLVFDAVHRTLTSTFPLSILPTNLIMAPDGLTAYLIGSGTILYYDILSGTADLSATFPVNQATFGNTIFGPAVFIHPDGTRLFFDNSGYSLGTFDLTARKVTTNVPYSFPVGDGPGELQMSQDGSTIILLDRQGNVSSYDTLYWNVIPMFTGAPLYGIFAGPAGH